MRVETKEFERAQGRTPRGFGGWVFTFVRTDGRVDEFAFQTTAGFGEARRQAVAAARAEGDVDVVRVAP